MKLAVTYDNGEIFQHFGQTREFKIYEVEGKEVLSSNVMGTNGEGHGSLAGYLKDLGVAALICGGIGGGARNALSEVGIELYPGVGGNADKVVESFLAGNLNYNPDTRCNHHHEGGEHDCHHEGGSCGH